MPQIHSLNLNFQKVLARSNLLSIQQQKIMLLAYLNEGHINYKEQSIFRCEQSFNRAMGELVKQRIMSLLKGDGYYDGYKLEYNGAFYVQKVMLS